MEVPISGFEQLVLLVGLLYVALVVIYFWGCSKVGKAAERKNRSRRSFFWLSIVFNPLVTAFVVAVLPFTDSDPRNPKNKAE